MKKSIVLMFVLTGLIFAEQISFSEYLLVEKNKKAPDFSLYDVIKREKHSLAGNRDKKLVLINFFATYCGPCKLEFPGFVRLYDKNKDKIEILAVSIEKDIRKISAFAKEYKLTFPVFMDYTKVCINQYIKQGSTAALPTNILVDREGYILEITNTLEEKKLEEWIIKYAGDEKDLPAAINNGR
jgi:peroxiredoxin